MKCIYKITNLINGKVYVGQTKNLKERIRGHKKSAKYKSNSNYKYKMYDEVRELGWDNFLIEEIENCEDERADDIEEFWIKKYMDVGMSYNNTSYARFYEDPEIIRKCTELRVSINHGRRKRVEQYDLKGNLLATYEGVREAGRITGLSHHTIQKVANGDKHRNTGGGYIWKYAEK